MTAKMRLMRENINRQYAEIAKLNRNIETLNRQNGKFGKQSDMALTALRKLPDCVTKG